MVFALLSADIVVVTVYGVRVRVGYGGVRLKAQRSSPWNEEVCWIIAIYIEYR